MGTLKKIVVEVTEEEYAHLQDCASQLHLRSPAQWLLLAGMNMKPQLGAAKSLEPTPIKAGKEADTNPWDADDWIPNLLSAERERPTLKAPEPERPSLKAEDYAEIARRTKSALDDHEADLREAAKKIATDYLSGKVAGTERLGNSEHAAAWRRLLRPSSILAAYRRLLQRTYGPDDPSDSNERWPNRISYGTFRDWLKDTTKIELETKKGDLSLYFFLDALRDVYVLAMRDRLPAQALSHAPHRLVVRLDNGHAGRGAGRASPYAP